LGYIATMDVKDRFKIPSSYSEKVAVADAKRVMSEYIADGCDVVWAHGSQFAPAIMEMAPTFPNVKFIAEGDGAFTNIPTNVWVIDRYFYMPSYAIGVLAGLMSTTKKVGFVTGLKLPFTIEEVNSFKQAFDKYAPGVEIHPIWIGDFNDPTKARQAAESLIAEGCDVFIDSANLNFYGVVEAIRSAPKTIYITNKYVDKSHLMPKNTIGAYWYDFRNMIMKMMNMMAEGKGGGQQTPMEYGPGKETYLGAIGAMVPSNVKNTVLQVDADLASGKIKPVRSFEEK